MRTTTAESGRAAAPSLSVVIPTLDEASTVPALVQRLLAAQDPGDRADEVVVVDGGSGDDTVAVAERAGARVLTARRGRGSQLAAGAAIAGGDVLLFLHADCLPAPGALVALRRAYADPATAGTAMRQRIDAAGRFYRLVERAADRRSRRGVVFGDSGLGARREVYDAAGGFSDLPLFEDVDFARRLRDHTRVRWLADAELVVSPRRWQAEGPLRCTLRNWVLRFMYRVGVPATQLRRLYPSHSAVAGRES